MLKKILATMILPVVLASCTVHPAGESTERQAALTAGRPYEKRELPALGDHPTSAELVHYALAANADVETSYWQWRSAIEQIPIDGTQSTNLAISLGTTFNNGQLAQDRTVLTAANDPMADIVLPGKLSTAAQRALDNARAAGRRFHKAQFELRRKVITAYDDYALSAELIRLGEENIQLLQTAVTITQSRSRSGLAGQQDVLKSSNELDLAKNDLENMRAQLPIQLAALNALLDRDPAAVIALPDSLPATHRPAGSDQDLLDLAAKANPELIALADEIRAKHQDIQFARLQYVPDFDIAASSDLKGMTQALLGSFTIPILRYEALHAAVEQAQANLRAAESMRRQTARDLAAQLVDDIATLRDADRQIDLLDQTVLPRAREVVMLTRTAYQNNNATLLDLLDSQRSLIDIERLSANLRVTCDKRLAEIEAIDALAL
jgi:outer membrane protein TolC